MAELKVYHDAEGRTLAVWFASPKTEYICEETGAEVILIKDRSGHVIGFEKLNYPKARSGQVKVAFESVGK